MTTQQTDALQCAADLEYSIARHGMQDAFTLNAYSAMKMVRTQHARIADLEAQLEAIGAGGVSGPLIGQPQAMPDLSQLTERGAKAWAGVDAQGLREGFTAADMATVSAQGFRDGVASVSAVGEPVANNRPSLEEVFRRLSDRAYCNYIEQSGRDACLGWEHKAAHGKFGEAELKGHTIAGEMLGRHKAFAEAANALRGSDAPLTYPSPPEGMGAAKEQQAGAFQAALDIRTAQGWKLGGDKVPVLYTDEINEQQVCRDDVWLCTTDAFTHPSPPEGMAGWTTLPGQMPEPNTPVLLDIGKKFTIRALWAEKHTVPVGTDVDDWGEYDEETDEYYCPEGWYEWNEHEEVHWAVSETPRAWRELPQPLPAATGPADGESNE